MRLALVGLALLVSLTLGGCRSAPPSPEPCPSCRAPRPEADGTCDRCGAVISIAEREDPGEGS